MMTAKPAVLTGSGSAFGRAPAAFWARSSTVAAVMKYQPDGLSIWIP